MTERTTASRSLPLARLLLLLAAATGAPALAEDPCTEDLRRLCPDVKPGSGRVVLCLRENRPRLSTACGEKLDADALRARQVIEGFGKACRMDIQHFCPGVEPGGGRMLGCLSQYRFQLATECEAEVTRIGEARELVTTVRRSCTADVERLCQGVPPQAEPLLACLKANEANLSSGCNAADLRRATEAASLVDVIEQMSSQDRIKEALEILQGVDAISFTRSQVLLQIDSYRSLGGTADALRLLFNPQFVFGQGREFAFQLKVPVATLFPQVAGVPTLSGLGDVTTAFSWNVQRSQRIRQYLSLGLVWPTAAQPALGPGWAVQPAYAVSLGLARWLSVTAQVAWVRALTSTGGHPSTDLVVFEPILVANLPGRSFLALDTKLGWNRLDDSFVPVMKGVAGLFTDRQRALSISAWYQSSLTRTAAAQTFDFEIGLGLAWFFDW